MAAPADRTMSDLSGNWVMDKTLSDSPESILKLQGISWITRKAISLATLTLHIKEYRDADDAELVHIDIEQTATGGLKGTSEKRSLDWQPRPHKDHIFGSVEGRTRFVRAFSAAAGAADAAGAGGHRFARPDVDMQSKIGADAAADAAARRFLRGEILLDGSPCEGFLLDESAADGEGEGLWLQSFVINQDPGYGWTAEQIWGFEMVDGERHYVRRVVAVDTAGKVEMARLVYKFVGSLE